MNDMLGPEVLVPSALVFGEYSHTTTKSEPNNDRTTQAERAHLADIARKDMGEEMSSIQLKRVLHHSVPSASDRAYEPGDKVVEWREKILKNRMREWLGTYLVIPMNLEKKLVYIRDNVTNEEKPFNLTQLKPYWSPEILSHSFLVHASSVVSNFRQLQDDSIYMTEFLDPEDQRAASSEINEAKLKEIRDLKQAEYFFA